MNDKFVLVRKVKTGNVSDDIRPVIRIKAEAYNILLDWCTTTGHSICDLATKAILYADSNKTYVEV